MSSDKQDNQSLLLETCAVVNRMASFNVREILSFAILSAVIALGAVGSYILGVFLAVPWPVARLFNENTLFHLTSDITFMAAVGWACFKLSHFVVTANCFFWVFLICKFIVSPKYEGGLRNPIVSRYQNRRNRRFLQTRQSSVLWVQAAVSITFLYFAFFRIRDGSFIVNMYEAILLAPLGLIFLVSIFGILATYRVGQKTSHREFLASAEGRSLAMLVGLLLITMVGFWRTWAIIGSATFSFPTENGTCQLSPMFPAYGGDLFYDQPSHSYIVLNNLERGFYWQNTSELPPPACLSTD